MSSLNFLLYYIVLCVIYTYTIDTQYIYICARYSACYLFFYIFCILYVSLTATKVYSNKVQKIDQITPRLINTRAADIGSSSCLLTNIGTFIL
ncbi:hypothetical protein J3Q64DRAFT_1709901 [Phycomyces blakesleeanus]|uniref:Uncharacterized protein n=1 Tax=Phycomyces blakesleeanus TaxID=4837 RepID=A0ABR3BDL1_PHYBL